MRREIIVISLGGSLIDTGRVEIGLLREFKDVITKHLKKKRFGIIVGGGETARRYQRTARKFQASKEDEDWLGVYATRINASLVRSIFGDRAEDKIVENPTERIKFKKDILVGSGWKPGFSTDHDAVLLAENLGVDTVINLTDVDYIYKRDPKKYKDARKLEEITWDEYKKIVGGEWKPGLKVPFDPVASQEAKESGLKVVVMSGKKLDNLDRFLKGKRFKGTVISG